MLYPHNQKKRYEYMQINPVRHTYLQPQYKIK